MRTPSRFGREAGAGPNPLARWCCGRPTRRRRRRYCARRGAGGADTGGRSGARWAGCARCARVSGGSRSTRCRNTNVRDGGNDGGRRSGLRAIRGVGSHRRERIHGSNEIRAPACGTTRGACRRCSAGPGTGRATRHGPCLRGGERGPRRADRRGGVRSTTARHKER